MKTKLLIFGITGDLGKRKLLPALEEIIETGNFEDLSIIGVSRRNFIKDELTASCRAGSKLAERISLYTMDMGNVDSYYDLKKFINIKDEQLIIYLAVPPKAILDIVENLGLAGLNGDGVKILFEKPFGVDFASAEAVISHVSKYFKEHQIYRIDHYLAKEMTQNIVAFRNNNALFNNIWNKNFIESIEVVASEKIGIENRVELYEQIGALRDVTQGHLMQLLALTLMDTPEHFKWSDLPRLRLDALTQLKTAKPANAKRGQYDSYKVEVNNPASLVETFAEVNLESSDPRWQGIGIKLLTGKSTSEKKTEIKIGIKRIGESSENHLIFRIQPTMGIDIELFTKKPGYDRITEIRNLSFNYPSDEKLPDAYEQVIVDAIQSQKSLFTSSSEVLESWRILSDIQESWSRSDEGMVIYKSGSDIHSI